MAEQQSSVTARRRTSRAVLERRVAELEAEIAAYGKWVEIMRERIARALARNGGGK